MDSQQGSQIRFWKTLRPVVGPPPVVINFWVKERYPSACGQQDSELTRTEEFEHADVLSRLTSKQRKEAEDDLVIVGLLTYLRGFTGITTEAEPLSKADIAAVNKLLSVLERNPIYSMDTILDPRFSASIHIFFKGHGGIVCRINRKRRMDKVDTVPLTTSSTAAKEPVKPSMLWGSVSKQSKVRNTVGVDLIDASKLAKLLQRAE